MENVKTSIDLNTLILGGFYICSNTCTNLPTTDYYYLQSIPFFATTDNLQYCRQIAFSVNTDNLVYTRNMVANTWGAWKQLTIS